MIEIKRLRMEEQILEMMFPNRYVFVGIGTASPYVDVGLRSNSGNAYRIRIMLPLDYPNSLPKVLLTYPQPLYMYDGRNFLDIKTGDDMHKMHVLSPNEGFIQLCHYKNENWHPNVTIYRVALKARIWIEAYEGHKRTGQPIDHFLHS